MASAADWHLMAGVVKWKPASYEQMEHTRVAAERLSFRSNSAKYHDTGHLGHFGKDDNLICRSLKSISKPKARQYVIVKLYSLPQKKHKSGQSSSNEVDEDANFKNRVDSLQVQIVRGNTGIKSYQSLLDMHTDDQASGFYLTNLLAAINIAVLLFEIASPVKSSENEYLSLPLLYGAKINNLILSGEWWRLLTPMCLHSGFLHIALGCWALLLFGPRVCRAYGQMTFFLIYILGGICGNLSSFVHTPEITVCGTGPVFSLIGAWLVYQSQNKQVIDKDVSESMFWQAVIAAALSFLLSIFGRIDNWAHLGATISGLFFGYLTCPSVEFDNSAKNGQKEAVVLIRRQAHPCKSTAVFFITILAFAVVAFAYGTQFNNMDLE
ncbi:RHOMBOID-like protein 9, chloroplastic isoform X3 [Sorghum bicolor]|uniref:RHOMBOID-like protein 9, chloroplastic isoform X3 n=1 Tax=Sorghum bicolor TaxID=4558 RepID=UPI000B424C3A|nr:RHOMBOID-like protein 9, chloroplastic isoform X3 [Sorghum bicolor]|eukprot:XP_021314797.1 RHOMBOID-like protein 9, chloroplastic isoform X3 [Sorghum bicolor]